MVPITHYWFNGMYTEQAPREAVLHVREAFVSGVLRGDALRSP